MVIGIAGIINIDYISNIYVVVLIFIIGLLVLFAAINHREKSNLKSKILHQKIIPIFKINILIINQIKKYI
jgi:hypothetical protein